MSYKEIFNKVSIELHKILPLEDPIFLEILEQNDLLPRDTRDKIGAERTRRDKSSYFIQNVIKISLDIYFPLLLKAMRLFCKNGNDIALQDLVEEIDKLQGHAIQQEVTKVSDDLSSDLSIYEVDKLWNEDELHEMGYGKKTISSLPEAQKSSILDRVLLLLLTVNENEDRAALCYLEPLPGHKDIYKYWQREYAGDNPRFAFYLIGKYGECTTAVRQINPGAAAGGANTAPDMGFRCFKNLNAIIGIGVACGVEKKTKICDVLVAEHVNNYDQARLQQEGALNRGSAIPVSQLLCDIFKQKLNWPDDSIRERLDACNVPLPKIRRGIILSGPYLIDDKSIKKELIQKFASEAIGIEMEAGYLFRGAGQGPAHITIVKAVCDFGDGKKNKIFQPTAALMAANCLRRYLDPEAVKMLRKKSDNAEDDTSPELNQTGLQQSTQGDAVFDCAVAAQTLRQRVQLINIPYNSMKILLYSKDVITRGEKQRMDRMTNEEQMSELIHNILIVSLQNQITQKYKGFLESMEQSEDILLKEVARSLGGSKSVPGK